MAFLRFGTRSLFRTTLPSPIRLNKSPTASISKTLCSSFINFHCASTKQECPLLIGGERALTPALRLIHSLRNSFHSATPWALRRCAVTGNSFGARGTVSSFNPASCGRRLPFFAFTVLSDQTRFPHSSLPPRERGRTWSRLPSSGRSNLPVY